MEKYQFIRNTIIKCNAGLNPSYKDASALSAYKDGSLYSVFIDTTNSTH